MPCLEELASCAYSSAAGKHHVPRFGEFGHAKQDAHRQIIIKMVPLSGEKFHFALLNTVLSAPMSFFVNTDSGVTLNRFSQDLQLIDMELPAAALNTFASTHTPPFPVITGIGL
jgi:hypothetical protein